MPLENFDSFPTAVGFHGAPVSPSMGATPMLATGRSSNNSRQLGAISELPMMTQAEIMVEIEADPSMANHIAFLLSKPDPVKAVLYDQKKAVTHVLKPSAFTEMEGRWPVLQRYTRAAEKASKKVKAATKNMGQTPEEDNDLFWQIYGLDGWDRNQEMPYTDVSGIGFWTSIVDLYDKYGKEALKKNKGAISEAIGIEDKSKTKKPDTSSIDAITKAAADEQAAALATVPNPDPSVNVNPGMKKSTKVGIGVAAGAVGLLFVGGLLWFMTRKKK